MTPDAAYRALFSHRELVADLLSGFAAREWIDELDLSTLEPCKDVFVTEELRERRSDIIWRLRWRGHDWLYVYVLLEFQSRVHGLMALRVLSYTALLYQDLARAGLTHAGKVPPVLPIVLYNGEDRWRAPLTVRDCIQPGPEALNAYLPEHRYVFLDEGRMQVSERLAERNLAAAVFTLEQSRTPADMRRVVDALHGWLGEERQETLRRSFAEWVGQVLMPARLSEAPIAGTLSLDGVRSMLAEKVERWVKEWKAQGLEEGRAEGREEAAAALVALIRRQVAAGHITLADGIAQIEGLVADGMLTADAATRALASLRGDA